MKKWHPYLILILSFILILPFATAQAANETENCGITNLATCIPQKLFQYTLVIINLPLLPLLTLIKNLLSEPVDLSLFTSLWAIILYILSLFYGLLLMYSGFNFIISGHDVEKRENAKTWLKNIVIMIVLIQASFFLYSLALQISSLITAGVLNMINEKVFLLTADNLVNLGIEILFSFVYLITLLLTALILSIRYLIVAVGVVLVPIAIFFYFIQPLSSYGKIILNFLGVCIFITFFDVIILLASSKLLEIPLYQNFKILIMTASFFLINIMMFYFMLFSIIKSAFSTGMKVKTIATTVSSLAT